ncbi:hemolysin family protein [Bosea sp. (in: a-proteobacteria)]|uniref:hemolysin family protein n=1 Tax=Bosea sp. (in: a-proteobacteria) TaxID=1871050 RepID=UPI001AD586AC|nr:hemolysin family protein [Bosea sp. (in: a-proteobacteria)]MBN9435800.1 HlyC/CorC family transporter [Bosea sp. (in: a-proteobacteria)]
MPSPDGSMFDIIGILAVLFLVAANGFFVAAEFSLVSVRRSRVTELVAAGRMNATALQVAVDNLDANLAATQLGITISSLALGWVGEPALAHLIEPLLQSLPGSVATASSHAIAIAISFIIITALHIVLGELAPKSLALQRSEGTALWVVRPLGLFLLLLKPAILFLNGLGNLVLRLCGLQPGAGEGSLHSPEELKLLIQASQEAGIIESGQQEVVARVLSIGDRRVSDIMTPRRDVEWIDPDDPVEDSLRIIRECRHEQLLVGRGAIDEPLGMILKKDLLDQVLDGNSIDPMAVIRTPVVLHEGTRIFRALEEFKRAPVRLALVIDEFGSLEGIVTQTDLLEALAGDISHSEGEEPDFVEREDGSLLIDGMVPAHEAFERLGFRSDDIEGSFHTIAGFALDQLEHLPVVGEAFSYENWRFEVVDMDGRRIHKLLASPEASGA